MDSTIKLRIKIDGNFKEVDVAADDLADAVKRIKQETKDLESGLINSNQIAQAFEQAGAAVQSLQSVMHDLTDTYAVQAQAEARLEQVMRNTMDATDAEIQSIKDLAKAQQELGIVGDEVQLSAAQELATYLEKKDSLEALIPVMNDMIAQQLGYNASAESAVPIATMMGKVMEGQVKALSRYGYSFSEAQEEILKFGTEEERAATLAEVVEQSVGVVNKALAETPYGKIVQTRNKMGDLKETVGSMIAPLQTTVDKIASFTIAAAGIGKGVAVVKSMTASVKSLASSLRTATTAQRGLNATMKSNVFLLIASAVATVVVTLLELKREAGNASEAMERLTEASRKAMEKFEEESEKINNLIATIDDECSARADQVAAIEQLKAKYPDLVAQYIDEQGRITNLIGLQRELNRLRSAEKRQLDKDTYDDYWRKLQDYKALESQRASGISQRSTSYNPLGVLMQGKGLLESEETFYKRMIVHFEGLVARQGQKVNTNNRTEWLTGLKESSDEQLQEKRNEIVTAEEKYPGYKLKDEDRQHLADIDAEIEARKNAKPADNKAYWENVRKQKQAEYDALTSAELDTQKAADLRKEIKEAEDKIAAYSTKDKTTATPKDPNAKAYTAANEAILKEQRTAEAKLKERYNSNAISNADYERDMEDITIRSLERQIEVAGKYGQDETKLRNELADARISQAKNERQRQLDAIQKGLDEENLELTVQLKNKEITRKEYDARVIENEAHAAEERFAVEQKYNQDTTQTLQQLEDAKLRLAEANYDAQLDALDQHLNLMKAALAEQLADDLITQQRHDSLMLEEMVRYWRKRLSLAETYGDQEEVAEARQNFAKAKTDQKDDSRNREEERLQRPGKAIGNISQAWNGIKGVGDSFRDLASAITEADNAWDALTRTVDAFLSIFQSVMQVVETINTITKATEAARKEKETETAVTVAGNAAEVASEQALATSSVTAAAEQAVANAVLSTSNTAVAATGAASAVASIPYVGPSLALTWAATIEAALSAIPKFADGGIVYGPTLGLMGEYGGASSNPEVIAPLSRLRAVLGTDGGNDRQEVKFRIDGRELVGILKKQMNINQRSS